MYLFVDGGDSDDAQNDIVAMEMDAEIEMNLEEIEAQDHVGHEIGQDQFNNCGNSESASEVGRDFDPNYQQYHDSKYTVHSQISSQLSNVKHSLTNLFLAHEELNITLSNTDSTEYTTESDSKTTTPYESEN